jgi:hypothetical protein
VVPCFGLPRTASITSSHIRMATKSVHSAILQFKLQPPRQWRFRWPGKFDTQLLYWLPQVRAVCQVAKPSAACVGSAPKRALPTIFPHGHQARLPGEMVPDMRQRF